MTAASERLTELQLLVQSQRIDWLREPEPALARAGFQSGLSAAEWAELSWYGPLEPWLNAEQVSDLLLNGPGRELMVIERGQRLPGGLRLHPLWLPFIQRQLVLRSGLVSTATPEAWPAHALIGTAERRLRFALTRPPATPDGPSIAVRILPKRWPQLDDLIWGKLLPRSMAELLLEALRCGVTLLISGGTGSGKTTLTAALLQALGEEKRIVLIEEAAELPALPDSLALDVLRSGLSFSVCVRFALRQRPDLIVLGELRGAEALAMLQAAASGHAGIATIHAADSQSALQNLERMACESGEAPPGVVRSLISGGIPLLVLHLGRYGGRLCAGMLEEVISLGAGGQSGERYPSNPLFRYDPHTDSVQRAYPVQSAWGRGRF